MYLRTYAGLGQAQPVCEAAIVDIDRLSTSLKLFNKELMKTNPDSKRLMGLSSLVISDADLIIGNLDAYISAGCCQSELKSLEAQVRALPWTFQRTRGRKVVLVERFSSISRAYWKLIKAIQHAELKSSTSPGCSTP